MIVTLATLAIVFYLRYKVKSMWNKGQCKYVIGSFVMFVVTIYMVVSSMRTRPPIKIADIQPKHRLNEGEFNSENHQESSTPLRPLDTQNDNSPQTLECRLPKLDQKQEWLSSEPNVGKSTPNCKPMMPLLFDIVNDVPIINHKLVDYFKNSSLSECSYRYGYRSGSKSIKLVTEPYPIKTDGIFLSGSETPKKIINDSTPYDIVGIECKRGNASSSKTRLIDILSLIQKKPRVEDTLPDDIKSERINVQLIILESVSRLQFLKLFKKTHEFILDSLSGIEFQGLSITEDFLLNEADDVSSQFFQSITPLLTGISNAELKRRKVNRSASYIWQNLPSQGYYTAVTENCPELFPSISLNNTKGRGRGRRIIQRQPTHYYSRHLPRTFSTESEAVNHEKFDRCYGPFHSFENLLNYWSQLANFTSSQNDPLRRYFLILSSCTRTNNKDILNGQDQAFLNHLKSLEEHNHLNNSAVFIIGSGNLRPKSKEDVKNNSQTIHKFMPVSYLILPKWFRFKYKAAVGSLVGNSKALKTNFDVYETLMDLLDLQNLNDDKIQKRTEKLELNWDSGNYPRGISLFLPVPTTRDCEAAKIGLKVCPCQSNELGLPSEKETEVLKSLVGDGTIQKQAS